MVFFVLYKNVCIFVLQMCNKIKYDKIGAMFALSQTMKSKSHKRMEKRIYYCNECKAWHLTSENKNLKIKNL